MTLRLRTSAYEKVPRVMKQPQSGRRLLNMQLIILQVPEGLQPIKSTEKTKQQNPETSPYPKSIVSMAIRMKKCSAVLFDMEMCM